MSVLNFFQTFYTSVSSTVSYVYTFLVTLVDINFKAVSVIVETCQDVATAIANFIRISHNLFANVISSAVDFVVEIFSLLYAFILVLWKFIVFLGSIIYSAYQLVELVLYFVFSQVIWFYHLLVNSALNCKIFLTDAFHCISQYSCLTCTQVFKAISAMGTTASDCTVTLFSGVKWSFIEFWMYIDNGMIGFADTVRYATDFVYYGLIDLLYLKQETYLGLLICLVTFLVVANVFRSLKHRGMTFPGIRENFEVPYGRVRPNFGFDFSDNDESDENLNDDESDITIASSVSDDEEVEEYEVDDLTTEDEVSDSDSNTSIDIQLPPINNSSYNLRRSPSRGKVHSTEDFQKEIEKEKEKTSCVVCQDNEKSVLILPCRHLCLCLPCGNTIARSRNVDRRVCPLCRKKIQTIMNVYT